MFNSSFFLLSVTLCCCYNIVSSFSREDYRNDCDKDSDCQQYHYCSHSAWTGSTCETHYKVKDDFGSYNGLTSCKKTLGRLQWPDHQLCRDNDDGEQGPQYSTSRCYAELDYTCHRSYLMPCTPNYDRRGIIIAGQEESCPTNFTCEPSPWAGHDIRVCVPTTPEDAPYVHQCQTPFDCGFSKLEQGWPKCLGGRCRRPIE